MPIKITNDKNLIKKFWEYVVPSVCAMWIFTIYTMVDGIFVARGVGTDALAAINISMPLINLAFGMALLFAVGGGTLCAIARGKEDGKEGNYFFSLSVACVALLSVVITILILINLPEIAKILGSTNRTHEYVIDYLGTIIPFLFCYMVAYAFEVFVKIDGRPRMAIYTIAMGGLCNIVLDYFWVIVFDYGIKGAAFATGISQLLTLIIFFIYFIKGNSNLKFVKFRPMIANIYRTAKLGVADCVTEFSLGIVLFLFNNVLLIVSGESGVAIYTIVAYVTSIVLMTIVGINQGMQPLISHYYGRGELKKYMEFFKLGLKYACLASILAFSICFIFPNLIVAGFINKADNLELFDRGVVAFRVASFSYLTIGVSVIISGYFTSLENPRNAMIISFSRGLVLVVVFLMIFAFLFGEVGVWISMIASEGVTALIATVLYKKNKKEVL